MSVGKVIGLGLAVLLLASFIPSIVSKFNDAENATGASADLGTGLDLAQLLIGIVIVIIMLKQAGINVGGLGGKDRD